ncbi:hypothetical protein [Xenorhabdus bovienii]|uniref:hypothetical protein n=1 Tax=Xenorhabdus bovienii TaxID=40576 RepID=UPI0023B2D091|nr:hypothetical protein [Xenorhabdus bovienii]MDE9487546.1 hypothetical protein [Xenorhabdus bovienii]
MQYLDTLLYDVKRRIAEAQKIVQKRRRSVRRAERNLEQATDELYSLRCEHDSTLIESWGDKPDWQFIFDSNEGETHVMVDYKKAWIERTGLTLDGGYNLCTKQRGFAITFDSNSPAELHLKVQMVEFILKHLKTDKSNEKTLSVFNLPDEDCAWSFFSNQKTGKYGLAKERLGRRISNTEYDSLHTCLSHIQSLSNTDIIPETQLLENNEQYSQLK